VITGYAFIQIVPWGMVTSTTGGLTRVMPRTLSIDPYQTYLTALKALALTLFLGLLLVETNSARRLRWLVGTIIGLGVASALFGIVRQLLQSEGSPRGFLLPYLFGGTGYGQFISANVFSYLMEMSLALVVGLIVGGAVRRNRLLVYITLGLVIWAALVLSNSRGGILSLACQFVFLLYVSLSWYAARKAAAEDGSPRWLETLRTSSLVRVTVIVLMVAILLAGVFWIGGNRLASKTGTSGGDIEGATRSEIWSASWRLIKERPLTGVGFGAYFLAIPQHQVGTGRLRLEQAHNEYLDIVANGGFIALGIAVWFIVTLLWRVRKPLRSRDGFRRAAALGAVAGLLDVGVHSAVDFGLQVAAIAVVFLALIVIAVADERVERPSRRKLTGIPASPGR
jgi:O-antigen ligase